MAQEIFERYEKKYMLTENQLKDLKRIAGEKMSADEYGIHTISNIYFDTADFELIRASIERPVYKEKVRLRAYGSVENDSTVYLELKKKYGGVVYKRRVPMNLKAAVRYLYEGIQPDNESQIMREIEYTKERYELRPTAYVAYDRIACFGREDENLRLTFDFNIRCRDVELDLCAGAYGVPLLEEGCVLLEVKIPGAMPFWMSRVFSELNIYPVSFSKYGRYYKDYLLKDDCKRMKGGRICA